MGTLRGAARLERGGFRSWGVDGGLPSPTVTALAEGPDGTIWAGTLLGSARFSGSRWEAVTDTHEFARRAVMAIARGSDGSLWFAKENALTRYRGERSWQIYQRNALDPDQQRGLATNSLLSLAADGSGALWIGTKFGLQRFDGRRWLYEFTDGRLAGPPGFVENWIEGVAARADGTIWVVHGDSRSESGGVGASVRGPDGTWRTLSVSDGLPSNLVYAVAAGPAGEVWFGTADGLARLDGAAGAQARAVRE